MIRSSKQQQTTPLQRYGRAWRDITHVASAVRVCLDAAAVLLVFHRDVSEEDVLHATLADGADRAAMAFLKSTVLNEDIARAALPVWLHCHAVVAIVDVDIMDVNLARAATWVDSVSIVWLL
eukprot:COSAG02_NODE_13721_length_1357_cov_1.379968_1_plen_122_part_00